MTESLKQIAHSTGITVAMVIHQPRYEIWAALDEVCAGRTCYVNERAFYANKWARALIRADIGAGWCTGVHLSFSFPMHHSSPSSSRVTHPDHN